MQQLHITDKSARNASQCGLLLAFAYPDRIAEQRESGRFLLSNGRGAALPFTQTLSSASYLVAAALDDIGLESRILLAAQVDKTDLLQYLKERITDEVSVRWDGSTHMVRACRYTRLGALVLGELPETGPDPDMVKQALLAGILEEGLDILPWSRAARQLQQRLIFMHYTDADWPDVSDSALFKQLAEIIGPQIYGMKSWNDVQRLDLFTALLNQITWKQRRELDTNAPTHVVVPSGSRIFIDYSNPDAPCIAVRLQEVFGMQESPCIAGGRVPLTLFLLSPAQRPIQVTRDLASFWQNTYFEVRKELKNRYPKHYWPDDPTKAMATNRTRPKAPKK
jgi:ATP-dependent helicase HrpB